MTFGLIGSKITNKLIVAQMTKNELPYLDRVFLGPFLMYVNQSKGPFIPERILLSLILVFAIIDYALYCQRICQDICEATGWKVFTIKPVSSVVSSVRRAKTKIKATEKVYISDRIVTIANIKPRHDGANKKSQ